MENDLPCDKIKMLISAYFDDELQEAQLKIVEKHISKCPECAGDFNNLKNISNYLKNFGKKMYPPQTEIATNVINRLDNEKELTCSEVLKELSAFYDGELTLKQHCLISDHIKTCHACKLEYENMVRVGILIKSAYLSKINLPA